MMLKVSSTLTAIACLLAAASAAPQFKDCGGQWYNPSSYVCRVDSNVLCPIINGVPTQDCDGSCFTPYRYSCTNGELVEKAKRQRVFSLTASNPTASFNGQPIQAAGLGFWVGGHAGTYCPSNVGSICNTFPNDTTLFGNGYLATTVPGGQNLYWKTDGSLAFTQAHSAAMYNLSYHGGGVAYQDGGFFGPNGEDLITCPVTQVGSNSTGWKLFARIAGVDFGSDCVGMYGVVHDTNTTFGAWQYI